MHTIRANLYWEFQFVLGYIAVPRSRIRLETLYGSGVGLEFGKLHMRCHFQRGYPGPQTMPKYRINEIWGGARFARRCFVSGARQVS